MGLVKRIEEVYNAFGKHGMLKTEPVKIQLQGPQTLIQKVKEEPPWMEENDTMEESTRLNLDPEWHWADPIILNFKTPVFKNFGFDSLKSRMNRDMEEKGIVARDCRLLGL
ncbi:unnamed protein product [Boreogadus saida]